MATPASAYLSPEEYLERERKAEFRSEYFHGEVIAMSGASRWHGRIVTNLIRDLSQQLRLRDCNVYSSELRVSVRRAKAYVYPDIVVTCGQEEFVDAMLDTLLNPAVVVEVLSESTKNHDRGLKFESYRLLPSLMDYVMIAQNKVHVEHYCRQADGWLLAEYSDPASRISLASIGVKLQLSDVYEKVKFEERRAI